MNLICSFKTDSFVSESMSSFTQKSTSHEGGGGRGGGEFVKKWASSDQMSLLSIHGYSKCVQD